MDLVYHSRLESNKEEEHAPIHVRHVMCVVCAAFRQPSERGQIVFFMALICTTCRWIPASASQKQGPEQSDLMLL